MRVRVWLAAAAAVLGVLGLAGCGGNSASSDGGARLRLLNAASGYPALDLAIDAEPANDSVAWGAAGRYAGASSGDVSTVITATGSSAALSTASRALTEDVHYTLVAYGSSGALKTALIEENVSAPATGLASLQMLHLAPDAGALDVYLTGSTDTLDSATPLASGVASGASVAYSSVSAGTYRLRVTGSGDKTDLRLDVQGLVLGSAQVATLILGEGVGGVLVNGVLAVQQGSVSALANDRARVRLVAAVGGGATVSAQVGGSALAGTLSAPGIGGYAQVAASSAAPVQLVVNGAPVSVANLGLAAGGDYTLLVWGDSAAPQATLLVDDNRLPTVSDSARIRLVNGLSGGTAALTLKADFGVVAASVNPGEASAFANLAASTTTTRLDISSAASLPAPYTLTGVTIVAKGLYTMYVLGDPAAPLQDFRKER